MSEGTVYQEALRRLRLLSLPPPFAHQVLEALESGRPGPLPLLYEAGAEAGLAPPVLQTRGAGIYFGFCAARLAAPAVRFGAPLFGEGPRVQYLLQNLAFSTLTHEHARVPQHVLEEATRLLASAVVSPALSTPVEAWTAPVFRRVAQGLAGVQWAAYLRLLWAGTAMEDAAEAAGQNLGIAAHVAEDIRARAPRFYAMPEEDQRQVAAWGREAAEDLRRHGLRCLDAALRRLEPSLPEEGTP
ncbi:hypothetical protein DRW03_18165 [Corallococcus sp. H22C18031201]|uniref:hypothetical protein n=1 Tax=Citreicoccus inhibens TaxID=2849499 RepID=UPI000E728691|nr:hypothetical protein [Citreicoccus inhibens]MBU8898483.1 hypothetical protein [Citreicoccus inhibens]RJS21328.1 hypothetical protein DRW03_18165 [Corallococcus sp. H22C18031201]